MERDLGRVGLVHPRRAVPGPVDREEQNRRGREVLDEEGETVLRRLVDPVQVFDHEDDRPPPAPLEDQLAECVERARPHHLVAQHLETLGSFPHAEQTQQKRRRLVWFDLQLTQPRVDPLPNPLWPVGLGDTERVAKNVDEREVGHRASVRQAPPPQIRHFLAAQPLTQLEDEPRLADPGLAHELRQRLRDRKSTRLNSSHGYISYAVFCLKKKKKKRKNYR